MKAHPDLVLVTMLYFFLFRKSCSLSWAGKSLSCHICMIKLELIFRNLRSLRQMKRTRTAAAWAQPKLGPESDRAGPRRKSSTLWSRTTMTTTTTTTTCLINDGVRRHPAALQPWPKFFPFNRLPSDFCTFALLIFINGGVQWFFF